MSDLRERLVVALGDRYRLERELGAGGMATVFLAEDQRHHRQVAIKVLRPELAVVIGADRFLREIETTAGLQHPHILPLHDSGQLDGTVYYVMPFVEGESLRDRLNREKQLPVEDAVRIAREVASALDYAHRKGVIHRDIKPENILLHDGSALVADFGIALAASRAGATRMTETGMSLGTPHYMAPEQAMGERDVTARADVYSLGVVLYEMLTGEPPFTGATAQAIVAKVLSERPVPPTTLRDTVSPDLEAAVLRALAKLPADRFNTAADFMTALAGGGSDWRRVVTPGPTPAAPLPWHRDWRTLVLGVIAGGLLVAVALPRLFSSNADVGVEPGPLRLTIDPPPGTRFDVVNWARPALTPDGKSVVFAARGADGLQLYVRDLAEFAARPLPGTAEAFSQPSVSPDGLWVAFVTNAWEIKKVMLSAVGDAVVLSPMPDFYFSPFRWSGDSLLLTAAKAAVWAISTSGGAHQRLAGIDTALGEREFVDAIPLPDGRPLVSVRTDSGPKAIVVEPDGRRKPVDGVQGVIRGLFAADRLLLEREGRWMVAGFDMADLRVGREPEQLVGTPTGEPSVTQSGVVAYFEIPKARGRRLVWVDRQGRAAPVPAEAGAYRGPRLSPDGRRVAVYGTTMTQAFSITVIDVESGARITLPTPEYASNAAWDAGGRRLIYAAGEQLPQRIFSRNADGSGEAELVAATPYRSGPAWWLQDGSIVFEGLAPTFDIGIVDRKGTLRVVIGGPRAQLNSALSPDGRWIAYMSNETGRFEIYVQPWPALDQKWSISTEGGTEPVWSRNGRELFFRHGQRIMVSQITTSPAFRASRPVELFDAGRFAADPTGDRSFDIAPDGRFLMIEDDPDARVELRIELNAFGRRSKGIGAGRR